MLTATARALLPRSVRGRLQRRRLGRRVARFPRRVVEHRYGGIPLRVELADPLAAGWYDHDWDPLPELALLGGHQLRRGALVFDIGAHQGVVALLMASRTGPSGRVVAVEPSAHNVGMCGRNAELNGAHWVVPHAAAVTDRPGTLRFNGGLNGAAAEVSDYAGSVDVPAVTVDGLAARYGVPDVVYVDVEGFEERVLRGAEETFAARPDWFVEVHTGCGLEAAGGTPAQVLAHFPPEAYARYVHAPGDREPVPLDDAPPEALRARFFLTAIARDPAGLIPGG